jgi:hypothetical protein
MGMLDEWQVTWGDLNEIIGLNPSLRGMVFGYVAERKLRTMTMIVKRKATLALPIVDSGFALSQNRFRLRRFRIPLKADIPRSFNATRAIGEKLPFPAQEQ